MGFSASLNFLSNNRDVDFQILSLISYKKIFIKNSSVSFTAKIRAHLEFRGLKETKVNRVSLEWRVCQAPRVTKVILDPKGPEDRRVTEVEWVFLGSQVSTEFTATKDPSDPRESQV